MTAKSGSSAITVKHGSQSVVYGCPTSALAPGSFCYVTDSTAYAKKLMAMSQQYCYKYNVNNLM